MAREHTQKSKRGGRKDSVWFVASEALPFSKTGGLGDVAGALPRALAALGYDVTLVTPRYASVRDERIEPTGTELTLRFPFGEQRVRLSRAQLSPSLTALFLEHPFYERQGLYGDVFGDYQDNHRRFALLSVGALSAAQALDATPSIFHFNDWQTGLAPLALRRGFAGTALAKAKTVFTIHNLAYQGHFPKTVMADLGLPWDTFSPAGLEFYDQVNFLKAGLTAADALTTVSERYAEEIQTPEGGYGLQGVLKSRAADLTGILNGVDTEEWNPANDPHLPAPYDGKDLTGKAEAKRALLKAYGFEPTAERMATPLFCTISRLVEQKGVHLLLDALTRLLGERFTFVALGTGDPRFEQGLRALAERAPEQVAVRIGYDGALSHLIEAGGDFFLMPSVYEPCGLNQMYSLRYGTVPVVRATGGLDDTVVDLSEPEGTGIKFSELTGEALSVAMRRALALHADSQELARVRVRGMKQDFSWDASSQKYARLYESLRAR